MKTTELTGRALDYAVALAEGVEVTRNFPGLAYIPKGKRTYYKWAPSTGRRGDDIIDREGITTIRCDEDYDSPAPWAATLGSHHIQQSTEHQYQYHAPMYQIDTLDIAYGATRREAAMRAYVVSKLGDSVAIPEELR